jgi:hypothetical protein
MENIMEMDATELRILAEKIVYFMEKSKSADLAPKWEGATIKFIPKDENLKSHEISIDTLMHKIVMVRDNLRVLEQQVNSNKNLSEGEKLKLQGYITKAYGSLTSFNFMFWNDEDKFTSKK